MKSDKNTTFMIWQFDPKKTLNNATEEAVKYFRNKYKDFPYQVKEIRVRTGMLSNDLKNSSYELLPMSIDSTIFSNNILYVVFN